MRGAVARAAIVPLFREPNLRAEQVTQLVLGETAVVQEATGEWRRLVTYDDGYAGWAHAGYLVELEADAVERWRAGAAGWSLGAAVRIGAQTLRLPLRARVALEGDAARLPDGRCGRITDGAVLPLAAVTAAARAKAPERWALEHFAGAPYEWGGVTPWGVDCSGLVQTTFAARGLILPRDSFRQAEQGSAIAPGGIRPGDLLFFRGENGEGVTHVAFAGDADTLIHSTVSCGGVLEEPWLPGTRAAGLRERLVGVRRLEAR